MAAEDTARQAASSNNGQDRGRADTSAADLSVGSPTGLSLLPGSPGSPIRKTLLGAVIVGYAWLAGGLAPLSTRALLSVLLPGAVLGVIAYGKPPERIAPPESVDVAGLSYWIICIALLFEWEASAVRDGSHGWHPSLTDLINPLIGPHPVKAAAFTIWLLSGWALVRR